MRRDERRQRLERGDPAVGRQEVGGGGAPATTSAGTKLGRRVVSGEAKPALWKRLAVAVLSTVVAIEGLGRVVGHFIVDRHASDALLQSTDDESLRKKLKHDFLDPMTRIEYAYDMFLGWRAKPNQHGLTYTINSSGMRDTKEYTEVQGTVVYLAGGSTAWSCGASSDAQTLAVRLEQRLNELRGPGREVRVLNLSEQAYGLRQASIAVTDWLTRIRPSVVVFYAGGNDLGTILANKDPERFRTWGPFPDILKGALREYTGQSWIVGPQDLREWSVAWRLARFGWRATRGPEAALQLTTLSAEQAERIRTFFRPQLLHIHRLLEALDVPDVFVLHPIAYIDKPLTLAEGVINGDGDAAWWREAHTALEKEYQLAREIDGVPTVSLTHALQHETRHVYLDGFHMNDLGYDLVAAAIAPIVAQELDGERAPRVSALRSGRGGVGPRPSPDA